MSRLQVFVFLASLSCACSYSVLRDRIAVIRGKQFEAFVHNSSTKSMSRATSTDGKTWSTTPLGVSVSPLSNPSAVYDVNSSRPIQVAILTGVTTDTVPYLLYGNDSGGLQGEKIGSGSIPADLSPDDWSVDAVVIKRLHKDTFAFARSQEKKSHIYWSYNPEDGGWSKWAMIGDGSDHVTSDPGVAINTFVKRLEIFVLQNDGELVHAWQTDEYSFSDWHGLGALGAPQFDSTPAVHEMTDNLFNGMLQVVARATDGFVHHISQTTCDKVKNPWGPCTWDSRFSRLGNRKVPGSSEAPNPLNIGATTHGGLEIFMLDDKDGNLWRMYQLERGSGWTDWKKIGPLDDKNTYSTIPAIFDDDNGWWNALSIGSSDNSLHTYTQPRSISADQSIDYAKNLTVSWSVPVDDASRKDWLGVFPTSASSDGFIDFRYVGGTQNPRGDPVTSGKLPIQLFLPDGGYTVRYMITQLTPPLMEASFTSSGESDDPEWVKLYRGIALGLGNMSADYIQCVEDGNRTIETFRDAFKDFRDRKIIEGLHLFAQGLSDISNAITDCGETPISNDLLEFIRDLISCTTEEDCLHFVIDVTEILLIFYENEYEIYGDLLAADNSFKLAAYEQGGLCIGRVTYACLTLPSISKQRIL